MKIIAAIFIGLFLLPVTGMARGRFAMGPEIGFSVQSHSDPQGHQLAWTTGFPFGLSGVYEFERDLKGLGLDYSIGYSPLSRLTNRGATIDGTKGTYRENLGVFHWLSGIRYYFSGISLKPYAGLGFGFEYFKRSNVEFRDQFNTLLPTPSHTNHFNFALVPQIGIEFRPTFRWAIGIAARLPMAFRSTGIVPAVQIPITVQVAF